MVPPVSGKSAAATKAVVLEVETGYVSKAYRLPVSRQSRVINDEFSETPLTAIGSSASQSSRA